MVSASTFKKGASSAADIASNAKYLDDIAANLISTADDITELTADLAKSTKNFKSALGTPRTMSAFAKSADKLPVDQLKALKKALGDDTWAKALASNPNLAKKLGGAADEVAGAGKTLAKGADGVADTAESAGKTLAKGADDIADTADDILDNIDELAEVGALTKAQRVAANSKYADMTKSALKIEGDKFANAGKKGLDALKKLPSDAQSKLIGANKKLRWLAGEAPAGFSWVKGACKNYPKMCIIGAAGGLVGAGFAAKEIYDKVEEVFDDKEEEKQACITTCLPEDYYSSKVSTYGTIDYKDLKFRTIEDIKKATGNDDININNTPLCTADMDPPEKCQEMCVKRCDVIHQSFLESLAKGAGSLARDVVQEGSKVAGTGIKGVLDGFFGEGMGIASAAGIFIVFIVIIIISTTL